MSACLASWMARSVMDAVWLVGIDIGKLARIGAGGDCYFIGYQLVSIDIKHLQVILQVYCGFALNNAQIDIVFTQGLIALENAQGALDMAASIILTSKGANWP